MQKRHLLNLITGAALAVCGLAHAQDNAFKIALILPMTGPFASTGKQIEAAAKLYMAQNGDTVAGKKVQLIVKDDAGTPDTTKRLAQEMVVNDKVNVLAGFGLTPLALATAPIATPEQNAAGGDGCGHVQHHAGIALHCAHQFYPAAGRSGHCRLGAQ
jgi:branched-chain amino acid transport system substrate-binding protein